MNNICLFDVDGTLCVNGVIPKSTIDVLKYLRAKGNLVLLCTGRCIGQLKEIFNVLDVDGAIINNGAYAYLYNNVFYKSPINKDTLNNIKKEDCDVAYLSEKEYVIGEHNVDIVKGFCDFFTIDTPRRVDEKYIIKMDVYSLGLYSLKSLDYLIDKYPELSIVKVNPFGYDVFNKGVSKAGPIKELRKMFPKHKIIGFGDNYNDVEMLSTVDIAVVMPTAPKEVKVLADYITLDLMDDGISYAIKELLKL